MRVAYVDMVGGAAGDMLLAAFLDAGLDRAALERTLRTIVPDGWTLTPERVTKRGIAATYAGLLVPGEDGDPHHHHHHHLGESGERRHGGRRLAEILALLDRSGLGPRQRERAAAVYRRLGEAEARVHGASVDEIHFHEVGQVDAILDVAAFCIALDLLGIEELRCSPFPIGLGMIGMEHGRYPNPPPATAELMRGFPTRSLDVNGELVTTTAAAILTTLAKPGRFPELVVETIGYGAGRSDFAIPNVTRVLIGTVPVPRPFDKLRTGYAPGEIADADEVSVLEANIDDMSPQHYELALERLFAAGARDVWMTPVVMKKGRPAIVLSAIAPLADETAVAHAMLRETTTIGVRVRHESRYVAPREIALLDTPFGAVRVKRIEIDGRIRRRAEYDDLVRIARERELPLDEVVRVVDAALVEGAAP